MESKSEISQPAEYDASKEETNDKAGEPNDKSGEPTDKAGEPNDKSGEPTDKAGEPNDKAEEPNDKADVTVMSHKDLMDKVKSELAQLIKNDSLLNDLPGEITVEEVNSQIALEHGQAMTVYVVREDEEMMPIVVTQNATVQDLKHAIKRYFQLKLSREGTPRFISWRHIWKRYWLYYEGIMLSEDKKRIKDYGIRNKDAVSFRKRLVKR